MERSDGPPAPPAGRDVIGDTLRVPRAADVLADHLRQKILDGELAPGTMLPPERELAEQSGLGRSSVREALRTLEMQGLIDTRPGRGGGRVVIEPTHESLASSVGLFIRGSRVQLSSIVEVREQLEPVCAALAARRRSQSDIDALREINARMAVAAARSDNPSFLQANVEWHVAVAVASHNELFAGFMRAISEAVHRATDVRVLDAVAVREAALRAHERIFAAILDGDPERARRRMARHVRAYRDELQVEAVPGSVPLEGEAGDPAGANDESADHGGEGSGGRR